MNEPVLEQALPGIASALSHLVVVGGTAHRLFAEHPLATPNRVELLTTEDVDIAAPDRLARDESNTLLEALKAQGFHGACAEPTRRDQDTSTVPGRRRMATCNSSHH